MRVTLRFLYQPLPCGVSLERSNYNKNNDGKIKVFTTCLAKMEGCQRSGV